MNVITVKTEETNYILTMTLDAGMKNPIRGGKYSPAR